MVNLKLGQVDVFHRNKESNTTQYPAEEEDVDASEFEEYEPLPKKVSNRRPREDKFTQQRLAAINPVLTPRTVLPVYVLVAAVFVIVGGCLLAESAKVDQIKIYYQDCMTQAGTDSFTDMNSSHYEYYFHKNKTFKVAPQWRFVDDTSDDFKERGTCQLRFTIPSDMKHTVYVNYMLEKFAANHRRYVLSFSEEQLNGDAASYDVVHERSGINCKPLARNSEGKLYYPCGLIANAMFNDTFPFELVNVDDSSKNYALTNKGINWKSDGIRFKNTKYNYTDIAPPPYWEKSYPDGYNETNVPNVHEWEEFQNWMRPGAFDKSTKLIRRNQNDTLPAGTYQIDIGLHWPVNEYNGKKAVFITHGSTIGGKNEFLGEIYLIGGCICFAMALVLLSTWLMTGRKIADPNALSWNKRT
ncbi:similar to Saccharomyces cerevisiae YNL323W LEM3 Membrane protein of the plasma membrane and ER, interacts specifically in vivo with the phospholipid translocase (flippase) Dnf1p [Maudiozyma barnettii]|uniref:Similar to Saccharomyces cerevisiae YNL323W LEM3 Membrane protein of the plasma membrane and ER, interacts specifically in vivo with the phospholipid translocase (Flippase) Dnf1p n=1 Tax=Maudiozyma barnettii TaxID=61262 RepID=A0A8H2VJZ5_9SACH|nr:Lem3p [Kazachstania barnettii]CAB4256821.1 similar to Saccharomyces cerevisiae YNL323W LEM3 Membrane protein of the plasma membrane and ER, interacts specifically in vivo with the phospholipid translocase (flippase) Dnf1p [Kazachstania barnettii]CAD1785475.1 similar to Saccharomyces cerevisiae YNL323W LEM3 Membrane protein of the plasma membrane and ER, interacts specifically in vivo with the phospholipid translocase (flippase) Dnf1p [Kazachstania barnettii]